MIHVTVGCTSYTASLTPLSILPAIQKERIRENNISSSHTPPTLSCFSVSDLNNVIRSDYVTWTWSSLQCETYPTVTTARWKSHVFTVAETWKCYIRQLACSRKLFPWQTMSKTSFLSIVCRPSIPKMVCLRDVISNTKLSRGVWRAIFNLYTSDLQKLESNQKQCSSENSRKITGELVSFSIRVFSWTFPAQFPFSAHANPVWITIDHS